MAEIKILIVDDHEVVRDGLSVMMEREDDFTVVGEAKNGLEAVEKAPSYTAYATKVISIYKERLET